MLYSSRLDAVYNKHTVYLYSSDAAGDLMLKAVYQRDRALERTCSLCILMPMALRSTNTSHCLTITTLDN